jgi:hypothetical protein
MPFHIFWFRNRLKILLSAIFFLAEKYLVTCVYKFIAHWPIDPKVCSKLQMNLPKHT